MSRNTTIWITYYSNVKHYFLSFLRAAYWDGRLRMFIVSSSHFSLFLPPLLLIPWEPDRAVGLLAGDDTKCIMVACETWGEKLSGYLGVLSRPWVFESRVSRAFVRRTRMHLCMICMGCAGCIWEGRGIGDVLYSSFISVPFLLWTLMNGWMWGWLVLVLILVFAPCWESGLNFDSWVGVCGFDDYTYQLHLQQALIGETGLHNACVYHSWLSMPHW